jgi:pyruvate/2-oxoglutarate dehydrogenase complex dihydrolipoamide acyltransferase (E2) component
MPVVSLRIPQIGEGLQEARLVAFLKQPGDHVRRDEPIYQMETDKAVMDVESPFEGTLVEWLAEADQILAIGAEVGRIDAVGEVQEMTVHGAPAAAVQATAPDESPTSAAARTSGIPPRTRAYAKEKGVSEDELAKVTSSGSKLMPSDIDAYLAGGASSGGKGYAENPLSQKQRLLNSRLVRGSQLVVPGTMSMVLDWEPIERMRERVKQAGGEFQPSTFTMFAFCVAQALKDFPIFRSSIVGDEKLRTYETASLGIAVTLPGDELVLAVIDEADALGWHAFAERARERIALARSGKDQANEAVTLSLTNMQNFGIRDASPVVVPPAVATLFLGEVYNTFEPDSSEAKLRRCANIALTFDHRVANGVGAAEFMKAIKQRVETISTVLSQ